VGRALLSIGITTLIAIIGQTYGLQNVYIATLKWWPGFMFILVAILNFICVALLIWVDIVEKPVAKVYKVDEIIKDEVREVRAGTFVPMSDVMKDID